MKEPIGNSISRLRHQLKFTQQELCDRLYNIITKQTLSKYERGLCRPSATFLAQITITFNLSPDYFTKVQETQIRAIQFRISKKIPAKEMSYYKAMAEKKLSELLSLERLTTAEIPFHNPLSKFEVTDADEAENAAVELRSEWKIGADSITSVYRMIEKSGIKLISLALSDHFDGFCGWINGNIPFLALNDDPTLTVERKRFTALHELGHLLLQISTSTPNNLRERLCNRFASAMLIPIESFYFHIGVHRSSLTLNELIQLRTSYGISIAALVHRAKDLGVISQTYYDHIFNDVIHKNPKEDNWGQYPLSEDENRIKTLLLRVHAEGNAPYLDDICQQEDIIHDITIL